MAFVVPKIPAFSLFTDAAAAAVGNVTPVQFGSTSRIGSSIYATVPGGTVALYTAWGFMAGKAPPGTNILVVVASGSSMIRGNCYTFGGYARAYADISVVVEEFEPVGALVHEHSGLIDTHDSGTAHAEIAPDPTAVLGSLVFKQQIASNPTILINQETSVNGYQIIALDNDHAVTELIMPITPGHVYRWWIGSSQFSQCVLAGWAGSNISFDFGPVFFAFLYI